MDEIHHTIDSDLKKPENLRLRRLEIHHPHNQLRQLNPQHIDLEVSKMLRTPASSLLRKGLVRSVPAATSRAVSSQALSNPTLKNIEKRWEGMPLQEQADLWMALRDRMKGNWSELTLQEKKAGMLIPMTWRFFVPKYLPNSRASRTTATSATTHRLSHHIDNTFCVWR